MIYQLTKIVNIAAAPSGLQRGIDSIDAMTFIRVALPAVHEPGAPSSGGEAALRRYLNFT